MRDFIPLGTPISRQRFGDTKTSIIILGLPPRIGFDPIGGAQNPRLIGPVAAAGNALFTISCCPCATILRRSRISLVPAILHPFPCIAQYVVEPERIGAEAAD